MLRKLTVLIATLTISYITIFLISKVFVSIASAEFRPAFGGTLDIYSQISQQTIFKKKMQA